MARPAYAVNIADRQVELRYDLDSLEWFERKRGFGMVAALSEHMGVETTIWLLLAGLRYRNDGTTYANVKSLIQDHVDKPGQHMGDVTNQIVEAMRHFGILPPQEYDAKADGASGRPAQPRAE